MDTQKNSFKFATIDFFGIYFQYIKVKNMESNNVNGGLVIW